jgi:hypothetical protein
VNAGLRRAASSGEGSGCCGDAAAYGYDVRFDNVWICSSMARSRWSSRVWGGGEGGGGRQWLCRCVALRGWSLLVGGTLRREGACRVWRVGLDGLLCCRGGLVEVRAGLGLPFGWKLAWRCRCACLLAGGSMERRDDGGGVCFCCWAELVEAAQWNVMSWRERGWGWGQRGGCHVCLVESPGLARRAVGGGCVAAEMRLRKQPWTPSWTRARCGPGRQPRVLTQMVEHCGGCTGCSAWQGCRPSPAAVPALADTGGAVRWRECAGTHCCIFGLGRWPGPGPGMAGYSPVQSRKLSAMFGEAGPASIERCEPAGLVLLGPYTTKP